MKYNCLKLISTVFTLCVSCLNLRGAQQYIPQSRYAGKLAPQPVKLPHLSSGSRNEMRGVWIATIFNLDYPRPVNQEKFKGVIRNMFRNLAQHNFNAVFFQVRPANDAFYPSQLNPWSRFYSGQEGQQLTGSKHFDPLRFMIEEARRNHLSFHAWLNPYRVIGATDLSKTAYLKTLAPNNFARRHPELVMECINAQGKRTLVLNPAEPRVQQFVTATVMEIVRKYPVASIHFDDYFYPDHTPPHADQAAYRRYNPHKLALEDWRRNNVTALIRNVYNNITQWNRQHPDRVPVRFGISPFGIWRNRKNSQYGSLTAGNESYNVQYADTRLWVKQRLIDYIVPQLYWSFNHDTAAYAALADWWSQTVRGTGVDLYIGHGVYQLGAKNWNVNELYYQLRYNRSRPEIKGSIMFSYRNLARPADRVMQQGGREMLKKFWATRQ